LDKGQKTVGYSDETVVSDSTFSYRIDAVVAATETRLESVSASVETEAFAPEIEYLNFNRGWLFLIALIIAGAVIFFVETAKRG
jgi:hypothetical protein